MAKIFLSHAHEDKYVAHEITAALSKAGLEPWLDVQELRSGDELLKTIAKVIAEVDYFATALTRTALTKPWVLVEMRMALTSEIEHGRPRVLVLLLDDCEVPIELRHKVYLDFRGRFDAALTELADHVNGVVQAVPAPKQTILAEMIERADAELWTRLRAGVSSDEWKQTEAANVIRDLRSDELESAVSIGSKWSGQVEKMWESDLVHAIHRATDVSEASARRVIRRLAANGFLEEANDLDYDKLSERAWSDGSILWILRRAARRSGLFPALPPPLPERLSSLLAYDRPVDIYGRGWYAVRFADPILTVLDAGKAAMVVVARSVDPARTWAFRFPDDRSPLRAERYFSMTQLTPDPFASISEERELEVVEFDLGSFDDLGLLRK